MQVVSTGIPALDQLTGIGGYPCGRITEVTASEIDLHRLTRWLPGAAILEPDYLLSDILGADSVGFLTPSVVDTMVVARVSALARTHGTAVVFLSTLDQEVPKALKFWAYLRLRIEDGVASVRKNALAATLGHVRDISYWLM